MPPLKGKAFLGRPGIKPWKKGQSGNPSGRPKGTKEFAKRMRDAFNEPDGSRKDKRTLTDVILDMAYDDASPKQMEAIKFCAAYGIGLPQRSLDNETVKQLAKEMFEQALEEARKRRALETASNTGQPDQ